MPAKLKSCVEKVKAKGTPASSAWPICVKSTGLKPHKKTLHPKDAQKVMRKVKP